MTKMAKWITKTSPNLRSVPLSVLLQQEYFLLTCLPTAICDCKGSVSASGFQLCMFGSFKFNCFAALSLLFIELITHWHL